MMKRVEVDPPLALHHDPDPPRHLPRTHKSLVIQPCHILVRLNIHSSITLATDKFLGSAFHGSRDII